MPWEQVQGHQPKVCHFCMQCTSFLVSFWWGGLSGGVGCLVGWACHFACSADLGSRVSFWWGGLKMSSLEVLELRALVERQRTRIQKQSCDISKSYGFIQELRQANYELTEENRQLHALLGTWNIQKPTYIDPTQNEEAATGNGHP
eukprot:2823488-Prorocentrum_lima.AAC.1